MEGVKMEYKQLSFWGSFPAKTTFILIAGKAGSGKTTLANILMRKLEQKGCSVSLKSFGSKVKECARIYIGWDGKKTDKGRKLLQTLGTEVGREYDPDVWVKHVVSEVESFLFPVDFVLIDDWRFLNELEYITNKGDYQVITIKVVTSSDRPELNGELAQHVSENQLEDLSLFDFVIYNTGTLKGLKSMANLLIGGIYGRH